MHLQNEFYCFVSHAVWPIYIGFTPVTCLLTNFHPFFNFQVIKDLVRNTILFVYHRVSSNIQMKIHLPTIPKNHSESKNRTIIILFIQ